MCHLSFALDKGNDSDTFKAVKDEEKKIWSMLDNILFILGLIFYSFVFFFAASNEFFFRFYSFLLLFVFVFFFSSSLLHETHVIGIWNWVWHCFRHPLCVPHRSVPSAPFSICVKCNNCASTKKKQENGSTELFSYSFYLLSIYMSIWCMRQHKTIDALVRAVYISYTAEIKYPEEHWLSHFFFFIF